MKEFLQTDTVTYNLMSFTAFKSMLIFSILMDGPKTYEEIRDIFLSHKYLNEAFSIDTLRVYINSLERMGCEIVRGNKAEGKKYKLLKHPFELNIKDAYATQLIKIYKAISKNISVEDLLAITKFFKKIAFGIKNEELQNTITNLTPLSKINNEILLTLIKACRKKEELTIVYNSPSSKAKNIDILAEELVIKNNKIYLTGTSPSYKNKANLLVNRIQGIPIIKIERSIVPKSKTTIRCELYNDEITLNNDERLISQDKDRRIIEIEADNLFRARQRVLSLGSDCKVISPDFFRDDIIEILKRMKEEYLG